MSEVFLKFVNMSISASWIVLAVIFLRLVLQKAPTWTNVLLWGIVAVRLICPFSIESILSMIPSAETISPEIMLDWTPEISTGIGSVDKVVNPIITESFAPKPYASANPLQILIPVCGNLWILGILIMLIYTAGSYYLLQRKVSTAVLIRDNIYQSEYVDSPFVLGVFRPKIYLPLQMDGQNLQYVVAHEMAHIRRKDHWWKPLGFILLALHWFNPIMWLGYILLCRDIEIACDEKVIKEMDNQSKADYTQALVTCSVNRRSIAACPLAFGEVGVKARVKAVMNYKKPAFWAMIAAVAICAAVAVCFLTNPKNENHGQTDPEKLSAAQKSLMERYPDYFGLDTAEGLDVYVWQMSKNSYYFGLLPHTQKPRDGWTPEMMALRGVSAADMSTILSAYPVEQDKIYIIPYQHPFSSYIADCWIVTEDMDTKWNNYVEYIRQMLFEAVSIGQEDRNENTMWFADPDARIDRVVLQNLHTQKETDITDRETIDTIVAYLRGIRGVALGTTKGWYGGTYAVKLFIGETEVIHLVIAEAGGTADKSGWLYWGYTEAEQYPTRYGFQNISGTDAVAFLAQFEGSNAA